MLDLSSVNFWPVLVGWLINVIIGAFWYSPAGFGKQWIKHTGVNHMNLPTKEANRTLVLIAISALIQVTTLALIIKSLYITTPLEGLVAGFVLWLGFTAVTTIGNTLYQRLGLKFWWLNSSYFLVVMAINSVILSVWQ